MNDQNFMALALWQAQQAENCGEVPVGAVIVDENGEVIATGFNQTINHNDPCAHAEIQALRKAGERLGNYRLLGCTLYVTLEPCPMCAGAMVHSRIKRLVYGTADLKTGAVGSRFHLFDDYKMNHQIEVTAGVMAEKCSHMLSAFFQKRRELKKQEINYNS